MRVLRSREKMPMIINRLLLVLRVHFDLASLKEIDVENVGKIDGRHVLRQVRLSGVFSRKTDRDVVEPHEQQFGMNNFELPPIRELDAKGAKGLLSPQCGQLNGSHGLPPTTLGLLPSFKILDLHHVRQGNYHSISDVWKNNRDDTISDECALRMSDIIRAPVRQRYAEWAKRLVASENHEDHRRPWL